jgi:hypothetical protein
MGKEEIIKKILEIKNELIDRVDALKKAIFGVSSIVEYDALPAWLKSRIRDEKGDIDWTLDGYGNKVLVITMQDPWTEDWTKKERKTALIVYFSYQASKPLTPSQVRFKLNSIYKVVSKLRAKGYHVFPALVIDRATPGAKEELEKHKVPIFHNKEEVFAWIYAKLIKRLEKLVEITKFTLKFDKIFSFLKGVVEGFGFDIPIHLLEAWALKPKYPEGQGAQL